MHRSWAVQTVVLTKYYGDGSPVLALDGVSLSIADGEFVTITGPSGSGKSTLLNLIGTLDQPTGGKVLVDEVEVSDMRGDILADFRRNKIGFIVQLFNLVPDLTALENVMLPLLPCRRELDFDLTGRALELLNRFGVRERMSHLPSQ
jgi:ABC-type lipoprotein export system ATPase subunit